MTLDEVIDFLHACDVESLEEVKETAECLIKQKQNPIWRDD